MVNIEVRLNGWAIVSIMKNEVWK